MSSSDYHDSLMDDWYFEQQDSNRRRSFQCATSRSVVVGTRAAAIPGRPAPLPPEDAGRPAPFPRAHGRADCHPWNPACVWHDGQRICWECLEPILTAQLED